jgi:hypothetical protein
MTITASLQRGAGKCVHMCVLVCDSGVDTKLQRQFTSIKCKDCKQERDTSGYKPERQTGKRC